MPTKRTKGLRRRDKMIMPKRLESESITQIADSVSVAPSTVFRTLKRLEPELIEELRASGLGLDEAIGKLVQLLEQKKKLQFTYQGVVTDEGEVEDTKIQFRATEILLRLHGALDDRSDKNPLARETSGFHVTVPINLDLIKELAAAGIDVIVHAYPEPIDQLLLDETQHEHQGRAVLS
jgi:hypothetical protein